MDIPFAFEKVAAGRNIIGREEQISKALSIITSSKRGIALYDAPRTGKETVVREVLSRLCTSNKRYTICEINLFNVRSFEAFVSLLKAKMKACYKEATKVSILPFDIDIDSLSSKMTLDLPQAVAQETGSVVVMYIKNFQNVATFDDKEFKVEMLDKLWSKHSDVRYIITGSSVNAMKDIFEEKKLFYSVAAPIELPPLDKRAVCEYISSSFLSTGRVIESEEALAIYTVSGGNMWYVKQLCHICHSLPAGYINRKIVNDAKEILLSEHSVRFSQIMFDLTFNQINFLRALLDGVERFSSAEILEAYRLNSSANVFRVKEALAKKEVITFDRDDRARIIDPLFEYWLRNYYFAE